MVDVPRLDAYQFHEREWDDYDQLRESFEWEVPDRFNLADYVCDRWEGDRGRVAVFEELPDGIRGTYTFRDLARLSNRLANALHDRSVEPGDRVAVSGTQRIETLATYIATWKLGGIVVPLSGLFGLDALRYRLNDCDVCAFVVSVESAEAVRSIRDDLPELDVVLTVGADPGDREEAFEAAVNGTDPAFENVRTAPEWPAAVFYTSGTTGEPKGVVLPHCYVLGLLPGFLTAHSNMSVDDVFWMPSEWSWVIFIGEVICGLYYGKPSVAYPRDGFNPADAFSLIERYGVTKLFFPPTALRMMMQFDAPDERYDLTSVRHIESAGEPVGQYILDWAADVFDGCRGGGPRPPGVSAGGTTVHEAYGQTEAALFIGDCAALGVTHREGRMGRPLPGHEVRILDPDDPSTILSTNKVGEIALDVTDDPLCFSEYWNKPERTMATVRNGWLLTGDLGEINEDGYVTFHGRKDDVILSAGYRLSPGEIEEALENHDAVLEAGVVGVPHDQRGEVPKAFVATTVEPSDDLAAGLREFVRDWLGKHEYPREIEFLEELPKTSTGKIQRYALRELAGVE